MSGYGTSKIVISDLHDSGYSGVDGVVMSRQFDENSFTFEGPDKDAGISLGDYYGKVMQKKLDSSEIHFQSNVNEGRRKHILSEAIDTCDYYLNRREFSCLL